MPRKKAAGIGSTTPVPFGMSNRVMKRKKPINLDSDLPAPFPSAIVIFKGEKDGTSK